MNLGSQQQKNVTQFHYTGWPDFGVPDSPVSIVSLVDDVRKEAKSRRGGITIKILVHCSAGVGRSGTFIGLCQLMDLLDEAIDRSITPEQFKKITEEKKIDLFNTVFQLRNKRMYMVGKLA